MVSVEGAVGTAVSIGILGLGLGLFAQGVNQAQRSLDQPRRSRRRQNTGFDVFDPMPQRRQTRRRQRRNDDVFNMDFF